MSRTLFWYILKDLLRIFLLTSAGLAGIMSFGGLLRPLTEHGLNGAQVGMMLGCFVPAMTTYSFPIAALFSTSMVYGRLSADNELTACRSTGISYLSLMMPALVLGLMVAILSLVCLCFVVPVFTLQVERIIYSNLAQLVQSEIEKTHQIRTDEFCVSAQAARVLEPDEKRVEMTAPLIVTWAIPPQSTIPGQRMRVPSQFWSAKSAVAYLDQQNDEVSLRVVLSQGIKFPRYLTAGPHATVETTQFGPVSFPSPIKEDPKFMQIQKLKAMYLNPESSKRLCDLVADMIRQEQQRIYLERLDDRVSAGPVTISDDRYLRLFVLPTLMSHSHSYTFMASATAGPSDAGSLRVMTSGQTPAFPDDGGELVLRSQRPAAPIRVEASYEGDETAQWQGRELHIRAEAVEPLSLGNGKFGPPRLAVTFQGFEELQAAASQPASRQAVPESPASFSPKMMVQMPRKMWKIDPETGEDFSQTTVTLTRGDRDTLLRQSKELLLRSSADNDERQVKLVMRRNGVINSTWQVRTMRVRADPLLPQRNAIDRTPLLRISIEGYDVQIEPAAENGGEIPAEGAGHVDPAQLELAQHKTFQTDLSIPMPESLQDMLHMTIQDLKEDKNLSQGQRTDLTNIANRWSAKLLSEINSRASFAISCLVLVLVGCALGMMFRSGNFLGAFAVSFVPAMLCIALIVTGQQICGRVTNGRDMGLAFIWSGNVIVFLLSVGLLTKLQRQ